MCKAKDVAQKLEVDQVRKGMFVSELDRPWSESPFLIAGFVVDSEDELNQLKDCCDFVYVDPERSLQKDIPLTAGPCKSASKPLVESVSVSVSREYNETFAPSKASENHGGIKLTDDDDVSVEHLAMRRDRKPDLSSTRTSARAVHKLLERDGDFIDYPVTRPVDVEIKTARKIQGELESSINASLDQFAEGEALELEPVKEVTSALVDSMVRNPDASFLLSQLKSQDSYTYTHSVDASILAVLFGRHLGLTPEDLNVLSMGVLLLDIGKIKVPSALLEKKDRLNATEVKILKSHVDYSLAALEEAKDLDPEIVSIVRYHHERMDGSGYPEGRKGMAIPPFARIAAIIDFYDAITHCRPYREKVSRSKAINALYNRSGKHFQPELVEEFIQCLGVYQTGELVLLSNGEVGIVVEQNKLRRLRPIVLIVRDEEKQELPQPFTRDLERELHDQNGKRLSISSALKPGAYGVSADDFYL